MPRYGRSVTMNDLEWLELVEDDRAEISGNDILTECPVNESCEFCDEQVLEECTTSAVQEFIEADEHRHPPYEEASTKERAQYLKEFHDNFNEMTGYTNNLHFREGMDPENLGAFNPVTKQIDLNAGLLLEDNPQQVMETIMHESRHAYQDFAINHPEQVSVDAETIKTWEYNFTHYISPEFDFEAYVNQPVEADANEFSERMFSDGFCNAA